MWLRYKNRLSGHEASLPVDVGPHLDDWEPVDGAEPSADFEAPTYADAAPAPAQPVDDRAGE